MRLIGFGSLPWRSVSRAERGRPIEEMNKAQDHPGWSTKSSTEGISTPSGTSTHRLPVSADGHYGRTRPPPCAFPRRLRSETRRRARQQKDPLMTSKGIFRRKSEQARAAPARDGRPRASDLRRWRRHLADERAEAAVYRDLAARRTGEERDILLALAAAEGRHEQHWLTLLGDQVGTPRQSALRSRLLGFLARHFGSVFVLALAQRAEARSTYEADADATPTMAADERIHEEVIRALASRGRNRLSGSFRAAVFGANDGLVSNLALVLGVSASGVSTQTVLITGIAGLLAGALSMGAGNTSQCGPSASYSTPPLPIRKPVRRCLNSTSTPTSWLSSIGPAA